MIYSDDTLKDIFANVKTISLVGASAKPERPSHQVMAFLQSKGFRVIPVNPGLEGQELLGERVFADVSAIEGQVDMIDIFRNSDAVPEITDAALNAFPKLKVIWMQLGVTHSAAAEKAEAEGVIVIQDRCPKIEINRLGL
ncbi:CoA-binding protein [Marivivens niveibacter]|uniref:CoA-binding protein n=1 Tax=Marivivens niveibacter TaxID=1930667 RepID=A0A251WYV9_9RHOB|nr:CoA-binding protein [Marivivens niveibacter]OUD09325.1 CoA-binding protein [Marivivens niveibacter]